MKLELKHMNVYLPHKLRCLCKPTNSDFDDFYFTLDNLDIVNGIYVGYEHYSINGGCIFPLLKPKSEIESIIDELIYDVLGTDLENFNESQIRDFLELGIYNFLPYVIIEHLHKNKYDIYGLIENGLAININTIKDDKQNV